MHFKCHLLVIVKSLIISYLKVIDRLVLRFLIADWLIRTILEPKMNES